MDCSTPGFPAKLMSIESVMPSNHLILSLPLLLLPSIFSSIRVFSKSLLFAPGGQSIGASVLVLPMNIQGWFPLGLTGGIAQGLSRVFSSTTFQRHQFSSVQPFFIVQFSHLYMTSGKTIGLTTWIFVHKVMSMLFNTLSRFVIDFLPRSKHLLISWLHSLYAVILESKKIKSVTVSTVSPTICHEAMGLEAMFLVFWMLCFKPALPLSYSTFIKRFFSSSLLSAIRVVSSAYLKLLLFLCSILISACASSSLALHMINACIC